ncbi:ABC transporter ATP-binding protein [Nitratiruptor sp. YY09-18]|uniref:ABC transporter ATP-binding protein/permease n=1 Tax=Nitratiruptor sp. YY09-18 TaxID=2724901 RepID=UPI001915EC26|nr:ABC transporter ATP-binding protein [Nitratiruptor sp. YY09-18]BCD67746.1 ATP-binding cassette, subfamily C, bacterial [Nitratiruptor sp. YY09-18]
MREIIGKLNSLLTPRDKQVLFFLLLFSVFVSLIETIGVGIIMPFISAASDFTQIEHNHYLHAIYNFFGFSNPLEFVVAFGVFLVFFYIARSLINLLYFYLLARFSEGRYHLLAYRLFENYMGLKYQDFIEKNSAHMTKVIVNEATHLVKLISGLLFMMSEIFVVIFIYAMLLWVNWKMTLLLTLFLGINLLLLKKMISPKIKKAGEKRAAFQQRFYEVMASAFGNFKIIKLKGIDKDVVEQFKEASYGFARSNILNATLAQFPRLFLEMVGFTLIALIVIYLVLKYQTDIKAVLPILMMFVLGLYRLMPSVNRIFSAYNEILFYLQSLKIIHNELIYEPEELGDEEIAFQKEIKLEDIWFGYKEDKPILKGIDLTIRKGEKLGIVGESGSGKSTLVDIIIGLYRPQRGKISVDGVEVNEKNLKSWRKKIGYIPQQIYLFDGTIAQNVAFGEEIDEERVERALKKARLLDFLERHHDGIYTKVGENGIKLSGGQKQRVAIARALYNDPEVLVLDEATSALDSETEAKIMEEIYKIGSDKTMIIVAHRISTLTSCNRIIEINDGKVNIE